jgi:hypothetical protein
MATVLKELNVKTRKVHRCFSCLRIFPQGTLMRYQVCTYEGDFCTTYACSTCMDIMESLQEYNWEDGYVDLQLEKNQTPEELLQCLKQHKK